MNEMKIYWPNSKLYLKYDEVASELVASELVLVCPSVVPTTSMVWNLVAKIKQRQ